jgi:enterochelin esterase-like enzyme
MIRILTFFIIFSMTCQGVYCQVPQVTNGTIERYDNFASEFVSSRNIDVWLPDGYSKSKVYNVLYMHDGQMLFDSSMSWNHQCWDVDAVLGTLLKEGKIKDVIVVGIWNSGNTRHVDYFPQMPFEMLSSAQQDSLYHSRRPEGDRSFREGKVNSDNYLRFIVRELKPFIDAKYATRRDRKGTFIAGSSMGGLISIYAICEYPKVFGGAACLSTHWPGIFTLENNPFPAAMRTYLGKNLPSPKHHRIYFDYGTETLDAMYPPLQAQVDSIMIRKGYSGINWMTKEFPGDDHSEKSWNKRLDVPLLFLLGK